MKRILCLVLVVCMLLAAVSCGLVEAPESTGAADSSDVGEDTGSVGGADSGATQDGLVYVSSENFSVTEPMIAYFENFAYMSLLEQYYMFYYDYFYAGDAASAYQAALETMSQYTLDDFLESALVMVKEIVALSEAALADDVKLEAEELAEIQAQLDSFAEGSLGDNVTREDVKAAVELHALASKYVTVVYEELESGLTEEALRAYMQENKADFYTADVLAFEMTLNAEDFADDAAAFEAAKAHMDTYVKKLEEATASEQFKRLVTEYEAEATYPHYATAAADLFAIVAYSDAEGDEIGQWLSDSKTAQGHTRTFATGYTEHSVVVCFVERAMSVDESATKDVAHILVLARVGEATDAERAAAKEKAEGILAEYLAGEVTLASFEALADKYNEDSNCIYEGVYRGQMVEPFEDWCFDESRQVGDTGVVETQFGYHVMCFVGNRPAYYASASEGYISAAYTALVEQLIEDHVTVIRAAAAS